MKTGLIIGIVVVVVLLVGIGAFVFMDQGTGANSGGNTENENSDSGNSPETKSVSIGNFVFSPTAITINKGDTVIWTNMDSVRHTVTTDTGSELDSPLFGQGQSYSHTFTEAGTYNYYCIPHPNMKGTVVVQ